ncbi:MAG TPA: hypothetical protein VFJ43_17280, partial [Bacteroidia bacterium]|nr:hypothetical protein [Bacteroidia bacterium]
MNPFSQRSSIPSSIVTGLVGWVGFFFIGPLLYGFKVPSEILFLIAVASALVQVLIMRVLFFVLQMQRHFLIGAFWGTALAIGMYYATKPFFVDLQSNEFFWILIYL